MKKHFICMIFLLKIYDPNLIIRKHPTSVLDITAEDPSKSYVKLRDFVLVKLCQDLSCFSREKLMQGFSEEIAIEAQQKYKK